MTVHDDSQKRRAAKENEGHGFVQHGVELI